MSSPMHGKTVVITGATSGIGEIAAIRLAQMGARIVFTARDQARAKATMARLEAAHPGAHHAMYLADLSLLADMKRAAADIAAAERAIDVLINNAGAIFSRRHETSEGLERTFALNHMSYFVLTHGLRQRFVKGTRIINTASEAHRRASLHANDLQFRRGYTGWTAYCHSKLCNILFTSELARQLAASNPGITANCLHPGFVASRFGDANDGWFGRLLSLAKSIFAISPEKGADTLVYLASAPEVEGLNGWYFYKCKRARPSKAARSVSRADYLWGKSEEIAGVGE